MKKHYEINGIDLSPRYIRTTFNVNLKSRAKALRKSKNLSEVLFWKQVSGGKFHGLDFDRQRIIGNFIVDFYCKAFGLVVEIDGASHIGKEVYDLSRENWIRNQGCLVIRFTVEQVQGDISGVLNELEEFLIQNFRKT